MAMTMDNLSTKYLDMMRAEVWECTRGFFVSRAMKHRDSRFPRSFAVGDARDSRVMDGTERGWIKC